MRIIFSGQPKLVSKGSSAGSGLSRVPPTAITSETYESGTAGASSVRSTTRSVNGSIKTAVGESTRTSHENDTANAKPPLPSTSGSTPPTGSSSPPKISRRKSVKNKLVSIPKFFLTCCKGDVVSRASSSSVTSNGTTLSTRSAIAAVQNHALFSRSQPEPEIDGLSASSNSAPKSILKQSGNEQGAPDGPASVVDKMASNNPDGPNCVDCQVAGTCTEKNVENDKSSTKGAQVGSLMDMDVNGVSSAPVYYLPDLSFSRSTVLSSRTEPAKKGTCQVDNSCAEASAIESKNVPMNIMEMGIEGFPVAPVVNTESQPETMRSEGSRTNVADNSISNL